MKFVSTESGAVTVDWVVLTAALVGLGLATMGVVSQGVEDVSADTESQLSGQRIFSDFAVSKYTAFYDAMMAEAGVSASMADGMASFKSKINAYEGYDDAALIAKIAQLDTNLVQWQSQHDAYHLLDPATVTVAEAATAGGYSEATVQNAVDSDYGGDVGAYLSARQAHTSRRIVEVETVKSIADDRGLTY